MQAKQKQIKKAAFGAEPEPEKGTILSKEDFKSMLEEAKPQDGLDQLQFYKLLDSLAKRQKLDEPQPDVADPKLIIKKSELQWMLEARPLHASISVLTALRDNNIAARFISF